MRPTVRLLARRLTLALSHTRRLPAAAFQHANNRDQALIGTILIPEVEEHLPPAAAAAASLRRDQLLTLDGRASSAWTTFRAPHWTTAHVAVGRWHRTESYRAEAAANDAVPVVPAPDSDAALVVMVADPRCAMAQIDQWNSTKAPVVAILAGPTPFITGTPHTLYDGTTSIDHGAVGAILAGSAWRVSTSLAWRGVRRLAAPMTITKAKGNVIHGLQSAAGVDEYLGTDDDGASPTTTLLQALGYRPAAGGVAMTGAQANAAMMAMMRTGAGKQPESVPTLFGALFAGESSEPFLVAPISAGDPSRGFLALDTTIDIQPGMRLQYMALNAAAPGNDVLPTVTINGSELACPHGLAMWCAETQQTVMHRGVPVHATVDVASDPDGAPLLVKRVAGENGDGEAAVSS
ncbi:hypothetical protein AMAG_07249 [Allomyces macrogynus ATCC 38327]|uniref:FIST domain-containing protein n=1 Tax=Allomyces macrogynus (strain ATCC 38327) TaxID=578462 RepID=A0A0L0SHS1_ALLM3|nr:hypothetical protein AMAG_07249 [Allomyces macrogynus ATCC 38327]|eukprot:KNE61987.1 hypothetical protein AMAG_07249 [Allomyces macrogynus ATCC 38327]